jgi:hypothetical protein
MTRLLSKAAVVVAVAAVTGQLTAFRAFLWPCDPGGGGAARALSTRCGGHWILGRPRAEAYG